MQIEELFSLYKAKQISGRYIHLGHIEPLLDELDPAIEVAVAGKSVLGKPIYACRFGTEKTKLFMWSQMHGNESTTTKALFDFFNFLAGDTEKASQFSERFTIYAIPMLNPDGAFSYTRENANGIDLNRDFCNLTQPESRLLLQLFNDLKPDYCFNLHDQRTIYGVGYSEKPATISFLAPSYNEAREINASRSKAISVIAAINDTLQEIIPGQVGRFDDSFNINCVGDTFQFNNVPTILFEAGHFPGDYQREETRKLIFISLVSAFAAIYDNVIVNNRIEDYLHISQNKINFYDFVYKNVRINYDGNEIITNFASQYNEVLVAGKLDFQAKIAEVGNTDSIYGHVTFDAAAALYKDALGQAGKPEIDQQADFFLGEVRFENGAKVITK